MALVAAGVPLHPNVLAALSAAAARQRWGAVYALSLMGESSLIILPAGLEAMGSGDGDVRWPASQIVIRPSRQHGEVADRLLEALAHGGAELRKMALYCLRDLEATGEPVRRAAIAATRGGTAPARDARRAESLRGGEKP